MSGHFLGRRAPVCAMAALENVLWPQISPLSHPSDFYCWVQYRVLRNISAQSGSAAQAVCLSILLHWNCLAGLGEEKVRLETKPCCCVSCPAIATALVQHQCYVITNAWAAMRRVNSIPARPTSGIERKLLNMKIPANQISFSPPFLAPL